MGQLPGLDIIEQMHVHLILVERYSLSETLDYSSTQLLAGWLRPAVQYFPLLAPALEKLDHLAKAVNITSGLGQTEIWAMFRDQPLPSRMIILQDLLRRFEAVQDPGKSSRSEVEFS